MSDKGDSKSKMRKKKRAIDRSGETQVEEIKREKEEERDSGEEEEKDRESENENEKEKGGTAKQICSNK